MVLQTNLFQQTNLKGESEEYQAKREDLRVAEIELIRPRQRERVASMRRALPRGAMVEDHVFEEGPQDLRAGDEPVRQVRLSELFSAPDRALIIYHLMYGKKQALAAATSLSDWMRQLAKRHGVSVLSTKVARQL